MQKTAKAFPADIQKVDFHMHSGFSDGTDTVEALLAKVKKAGIDAFSLTDHDSFAGCGKLAALLPNDGAPYFMPGIEFSTEDEHGKYHILGYGFRMEHSEVARVAAYCHENRILRAVKRMEFLKEAFGFTFSDNEIQAVLRQNNPGKPHIAHLCVSHGYAESLTDAIDNYLSKYPGKEEKLTPRQAIRTILESDGVPVLAHGFFGSGAQRLSEEETAQRIHRLKTFGLQGLECFYSGFSEKQAAFLYRFAKENKLFITAGSDYHGANKAIGLGTVYTGKDSLFFDALPAIRQFVKAVISRV